MAQAPGKLGRTANVDAKPGHVCQLISGIRKERPSTIKPLSEIRPYKSFRDPPAGPGGFPGEGARRLVKN
jgi:hypothetical protein